MKRRAFLRGLGGAAGGLALRPALGVAAPATRNRVFDRLRDAQIDVSARMILGGRGREIVDVPLAGLRQARRGGRDGAITLAATAVAGQTDAIDLASTVRAREGAMIDHRVALDFRTWSRDNYVLLPGACYAGNRFQARRAAYPPLLSEPADIGPHVPTIVPDIPRLSAGPGPSALSIDAGALAMPVLAVHVAAARLGVIWLPRATGGPAPISLAVVESDDRARATLTISARARDEIPVRVHVFDCADIPALFERLHALRKDLPGKSALVHERPFSAAFAAHEARVNARWQEKAGALAIGDRATAYSTWQTGWCGGLATTLPLIAAGNKTSRERALATVGFMLDGGQAASGFFHGISDGKTWYEDGFAAPLPTVAGATRPARPQPAPYKQARRWHLVRRTAETLTLLVKQIALVERRPDLREGGASERWAEPARRAAEALVKLWERHKQLGQFVDIESGELIVGGSTSAGIAPAGLALAAAQLKEPRYLAVAKAIGEHYYDRYVRVGLTCGGPGDALQAPDSESAAALLDSFMTLYEATRDRLWIDRARDAAHLLASWVISYDSPGAGRGCADAGVRATGAVFWSAAARRGSPGYVLSSGDALFRLYRATSEVRLLELLRETVQNLGQYLPQAPAGPTTTALVVPATAPADTRAAPCAGADSTRWLEARDGGIPADGMFDAIGLLSYTEVPGIYVRPDTGFLFVFDHVNARIKEKAGGRAKLTIENPTRVAATVRILTETTGAAAEPLRAGAVLDAQTVAVPAGGTVEVSVAAGVGAPLSPTVSPLRGSRD